jgi:hypothetical protein
MMKVLHNTTYITPPSVQLTQMEITKKEKCLSITIKGRLEENSEVEAKWFSTERN